MNYSPKPEPIQNSELTEKLIIFDGLQEDEKWPPK